MRLKNIEIQSRLGIKLDRSMSDDVSSGVMTYGFDNDYPQIIEKLILGSPTAKSVSKIYAKFLSGNSFFDPIGNIVIGHDNFGNEITIDSLRISVAKSVAKFNGVFIHTNWNANGFIGGEKGITPLSFKDYRFSTQDDRGNCGKIIRNLNWSKDITNPVKFDKSKNISFHIFNQSAVIDQIAKEGNKFKGQIFYYFLDSEFLYPLSPFDSVYLDMDTENQMQLYKNRQIRNGFMKKTVWNTKEYENENDRKKDEDNIREFLGADGDSFILSESEINPQTGELAAAFKIDTTESNVEADLFQNWEDRIPNNIRKAACGMPQILIDFDSGKQAPASGELLKTAIDSYNIYTKDERNQISECFRNLFKYHENEILRNSTFDINPVTL